MTPPKRRLSDMEFAWKTIAVYAISLLVATGGSVGGYRALDQMQPTSQSAIAVTESNDATAVKLSRAIEDIGELRGEMKLVRDALSRLEAKLSLMVARGDSP